MQTYRHIYQNCQNLFPVFIASLFLFILLSPAWAAHPDKPKLPRGSFACTSSVKKFEKWSQGFEHAAVAVAKAKTITGIRGCGWAWNRKSKISAERAAVANCRKNAFHPETCAVAKSN